MLNAASLNAVNNAKFSRYFARPLYGSYCFSNIPATISFLLTGEGAPGLPLDVLSGLPTRYKRAIMLFVDAFGWRFFEQYADRYPLLKTFFAEGVVSKLTAQFPSTTAAHSTTIHTGLNVGQSGIYEWHYYEPLVDDMITPLLFSYAGDRGFDTLKRSGIAAAEFYPRQTFYQALGTRGVATHVFQYRPYTGSTFSQAVCQGATMHAYTSVASAFSDLAELLLAHQQESEAPTYYFLYFDGIDAAGHRFGLDAPPFREAIDGFWSAAEHTLHKRLAGHARETLLLISADHGMIASDPRTTFYLNEQAREIIPHLRTNHQKRLRVAAGSARDMFLYVKEEAVDEAIAYLQRALADRAEVYRTADLVAQGFFGEEEPSPTFLGRVGNVVILPYQHETVWWYEPGRFEMRFLGCHGGLTPAEMEIPLLALAL